jgi:hypothetical protein
MFSSALFVQEMTVLTQQIMQQALIKRKLEEQKENYRRRQGEPARQVSTVHGEVGLVHHTAGSHQAQVGGT